MVLRILNEFILNESFQEPIGGKYTEIAKTISNNCSEWLKESQGYMAWRGTDSAKIKAFIGEPREDRRPKDANIDFQSKLDDMLYDNGFRALRSNSIFVTGDSNLAIDYGTVYAVFPVNGYRYTWNTKYKDLIDYFDDLSYTIDLLDMDEDDLAKIKARSMEQAENEAGHLSERWKLIKYKGFLYYNLKDYQDETGYKISYSKEKLEKETLDDFSHTGLADALHSGHEIYITCNHYYAIEKDIYQSNLRHLL